MIKSKHFKSPPKKFNKDFKSLNHNNFKSPCNKFDDAIMWSYEHFDNIQRVAFSQKMIINRILFVLKDYYCSGTNAEHRNQFFE